MKKIRILLADDQILFIESLKTVLETLADDIEVVNTAHNGNEVLKMIKKDPPDIVLLDVRMPELDGVETAKLIHKKYPRIKIMMLTTFDDDFYVHEALEHGAAGYMLKDVPPSELITSIRAMSNGTVQVSPKIMMKLMEHSNNSQQGRDYSEALKSVERLSRREQEVLVLMSREMDNIRIAETFFIAEQTVKNHISSIYSKLGIHDRNSAIEAAKRSGIMERFSHL